MLKTNRPKPAPQNNESSTPEYRHNPRFDAKIDDWIKNNPKHWAYIQALPPERMARALALSEVQKVERMQKLDAGILRKLDENPEVKKAYEVILKDVPEDQRQDRMVRMYRTAMRNSAQQTQNGEKAPAQRAGVGV
jgi:hypothetical protein